MLLLFLDSMRDIPNVLEIVPAWRVDRHHDHSVIPFSHMRVTLAVLLDGERADEPAARATHSPPDNHETTPRSDLTASCEDHTAPR